MDNIFDNNNYNNDACNDYTEELIDDYVAEHVSDELYKGGQNKKVDAKSLVLNLTGVASREEFHRRVRDAFGLPQYYGNNLDALHDCLTDISEKTVVIIKGSDEAEDSVKAYVERFLMMCTDVAEENENIVFFTAE